LEHLKSEIDSAQKARDDLMKWKLVVVAVIGAAALGLTDRMSAPNAQLALAIIPFACAYIDLLCRNLSLRSKLVSAFLAQEAALQANGPSERFEAFYQEFQRTWGGRSLETFALVWSTVLLSVAIIPVGIAVSTQTPGDPAAWALFQWPNLLFYVSGLAGVVIGVLIQRAYSWRSGLIRAQAQANYQRIAAPTK